MSRSREPSGTRYYLVGIHFTESAAYLAAPTYRPKVKYGMALVGKPTNDADRLWNDASTAFFIG
ncbi:MAG: hypothetical protein IT425_02210 [Pirellulales bacterium]|nr:hypothetical protein [Pirellulales bacterium]